MRGEATLRRATAAMPIGQMAIWEPFGEVGIRASNASGKGRPRGRAGFGVGLSEEMLARKKRRGKIEGRHEAG